MSTYDKEGNISNDEPVFNLDQSEQLDIHASPENSIDVDVEARVFEDIYSTQRISIFENKEDISIVAEMIAEKFDSERDVFSNILQRLEQGENSTDISNEYNASIVVDFLQADFSVYEIREMAEASRNGALDNVLQRMIDVEKRDIEQKIYSEDFKEALSSTYECMSTAVSSIGKNTLMEERWPSIVYAGKVGRMIIKSKEIEIFTTHCMAQGEYNPKANEAYVYLPNREPSLSQKEILETQVHETLHAISKNIVSTEDGQPVHETGFAKTTYNEEDPLASVNVNVGLNEATTEYFTRLFAQGAFTSQKKPEHSYDANVKSLEALILHVSEVLGREKSDIEMEVLNAYMIGSSDALTSLWRVCIGKFGNELLQTFPDTLPDFLKRKATFDKEKNGSSAHTENKVTLNFESIEALGVYPTEFIHEYPFVRLIRYDINPQTIELIEVELT